jgi:hypothetical protein
MHWYRHPSEWWMWIRIQLFWCYILPQLMSLQTIAISSHMGVLSSNKTRLWKKIQKKYAYSHNRGKISSVSHERVKNKLRSRDVPLVLSLLVVKCLNDLIPAHASLPDLSLCSYCHTQAPTLNAPFSNSPPVLPANRWSADEIEGQISDVITVHCKGGSIG